MSRRAVVVYGAGGHGKVVADIILCGEVYEMHGFVDDRSGHSGDKVLGFDVLGDEAWLKNAIKSSPITVALGIGDNFARRAVAEKCVALGAELCNPIHPRATVASSASLGAGTVVMAGAVINPDARVGMGAIINSGAIVEHDVVVGNYAHLSPNAATGGNARIGDFSHLGVGASILPGISVGAGSTIGAGAAVICDIPDDVVAFGVPATVRRKVTERRT